MSVSSVKIIDKGWARIKKDFGLMNGSHAKIGVVTGSGSYDNGPSIAYVASILHYGNKKWRKKKRWPFITDATKKGKAQLNNTKISLIKKITAGTLTPQKSISILGELGASLVKKQIKTVSRPPLEEVTKLRKGSSKPLIDKGQLLNSVSYEVKI